VDIVASYKKIFHDTKSCFEYTKLIVLLFPVAGSSFWNFSGIFMDTALLKDV
jgi:hypothetical protein